MYAHVDMARAFAGGVEAAIVGEIREEGRKRKEEGMGIIGKETEMSRGRSREGRRTRQGLKFRRT
jgi:hypothetical protein